MSTTHFSPFARPRVSALDNRTRERDSVCGVVTAIGGRTELGETAAFGSSNLAHVTCKACRRIAAERNLPPRAASVVRAELARLRAELEHLVGYYDDGDRQDSKLRSAIRRQKQAISKLEAELAAYPAREVA